MRQRTVTVQMVCTVCGAGVDTVVVTDSSAARGRAGAGRGVGVVLVNGKVVNVVRVIVAVVGTVVLRDGHVEVQIVMVGAVQIADLSMLFWRSMWSVQRRQGRPRWPVWCWCSVWCWWWSASKWPARW